MGEVGGEVGGGGGGRWGGGGGEVGRWGGRWGGRNWCLGANVVQPLPSHQPPENVDLSFALRCARV